MFDWLWTDWTKVDPHYFYLRGLICGFIYGFLVTLYTIKWIAYRKKNKEKGK